MTDGGNTIELLPEAIDAHGNFDAINKGDFSLTALIRITATA
jgi:hypothetical protein